MLDTNKEDNIAKTTSHGNDLDCRGSSKTIKDGKNKFAYMEDTSLSKMTTRSLEGHHKPGQLKIGMDT